MKKKLTFYCPICKIEFKDVGYDNPVFYADKVAKCPKCGEKCWEVKVTITLSEYKEYQRLLKEKKV